MPSRGTTTTSARNTIFLDSGLTLWHSSDMASVRGRSNRASVVKPSATPNDDARKCKPPAVEAHVPGHPRLTLALFDDLLQWIADGKSLRSWCAEDGHVSHQVVLRALRESSELRTRYARAREDQADTLIDQCLAIADDGRNDTYVDENGNVKVATDVIQRSKLRCEERHWLAGKLRPKVYGDKLDLTSDGAALFTCIKRVIVKADQ